jgi:hypothetical protein
MERHRLDGNRNRNMWNRQPFILRICNRNRTLLMIELTVICQSCKERRSTKCGVDGKSLYEHAEFLGCPRNYFENPPEKAKPEPIAPVPRSEWPRWAKSISLWSNPSDAGIGDTVKRLLGPGGEAFKAMMESFGAPCGCADRQAEWNQAYPLKD